MLRLSPWRARSRVCRWRRWIDWAGHGTIRSCLNRQRNLLLLRCGLLIDCWRHWLSGITALHLRLRRRVGRQLSVVLEGLVNQIITFLAAPADQDAVFADRHIR